MGLKYVKKMKASKDWSEIPIVFISALNKQEDILKGYEVGGTDFIPKPFDNNIVVARVKAILKIQGLTRDKGNLLKTNEALLTRLKSTLKEVDLHSKLDKVKKEVNDVSEFIYSQVDTLRSMSDKESILSSLQQIEMSLQFEDILSQQVNEISKNVQQLHSIILGDKELREIKDISSKSTLMVKKDQKEIDDLLESLGM